MNKNRISPRTWCCCCCYGSIWSHSSASTNSAPLVAAILWDRPTINTPWSGHSSISRTNRWISSSRLHQYWLALGFFCVLLIYLRNPVNANSKTRRSSLTIRQVVLYESRLRLVRGPDVQSRKTQRQISYKEKLSWQKSLAETIGPNITSSKISHESSNIQ